MTLREALQIIIDLAEQNAIMPHEGDAPLQDERIRQHDAFALVRELADSALDVQTDNDGQTVIYLGDGEEDDGCEEFDDFEQELHDDIMNS